VTPTRRRHHRDRLVGAGTGDVAAQQRAGASVLGDLLSPVAQERSGDTIDDLRLSPAALLSTLPGDCRLICSSSDDCQVITVLADTEAFAVRLLLYTFPVRSMEPALVANPHKASGRCGSPLPNRSGLPQRTAYRSPSALYPDF
jgi:hypothetical protein